MHKNPDRNKYLSFTYIDRILTNMESMSRKPWNMKVKFVPSRIFIHVIYLSIKVAYNKVIYYEEKCRKKGYEKKLLFVIINCIF